MKSLCAYLIVLTFEESKACSPLGFSDYTSKAGAGSDLTNVQVLASADHWQSDCCGVITSWRFTAISTGTLYLQVWQPIGGISYTLSGENSVEVTHTDADINHIVPTSDQIAVSPGYRIGWYSTSTIIDWYFNILSSSEEAYTEENRSPTAVGQSTSFTNVNSFEYSLYVTIQSFDSPSLGNLPFSLSLNAGKLASTISVFTVSGTTSQLSSQTFSIQAQSPSVAFSINTVSGDVSPTFTNTTAGIYVLTIRITDYCGSYAEADLTLHVQESSETTQDEEASGTTSSSGGKFNRLEIIAFVVLGSVSTIALLFAIGYGGYVAVNKMSHHATNPTLKSVNQVAPRDTNLPETPRSTSITDDGTVTPSEIQPHTT